VTKTEAIRDLIILFTGKEPPFPIHVYELRKLSDAKYEQLQSFLINEAKCQWLTGIGILEAIDMLVYEAIANSEKAFEEAYPTFPKEP
jgi:hypothetical protein